MMHGSGGVSYKIVDRLCGQRNKVQIAHKRAESAPMFRIIPEVDIKLLYTLHDVYASQNLNCSPRSNKVLRPDQLYCLDSSKHNARHKTFAASKFGLFPLRCGLSALDLRTR